MLTIKAVGSSKTYIGDIVSEMITFAINNNVAVELNIYNANITVFPHSNAYDIVEKYENGYFDE